MSRAICLGAVVHLGFIAVAKAQSATQASAQPAGTVAATHPAETASSRHAEIAELTGVQALFAQAANDATARNGFASLLSLFATDQTSNAQDATASASNPQFDATALNQTADQFNREWKKTYGRDFHVADAELVCADITPSDLLTGQPQVASERLAGTTRPSDQGVANAGHPTSTPAFASGANLRIPTTGPTTAPLNHDGPNDGEILVNLPPVQGSPGASVRVIRAGPGSFRFATPGRSIEPQRLADAVTAHLRQALDQRARWPIDPAQGQRLITQYLLMAIAQISGDAENGSAASATPTTAPAESRTNGAGPATRPSQP